MPRRRGFAFPLLLIALGLLVLFYNLGVLDAQRLAQLASLWPLLLVLVGLELILTRTLPRPLLPAASLGLTAVLLIAALAYVTLAPRTLGAGAQQSTSTERLDGLSAAELNLDVGAWSIDLSGGGLGDDLYRARFDFRAGERAPQVRLDRSSGTIRIQQSNDRIFWPFGSGLPGRDHAELSLSDRVLWRVRIQGGAIRSSLDLSSVPLAGVDIGGGATKDDVRLPRPKGTVGVDIGGGASTVSLQVPSGTPVRIRVSGGASRLEVDGQLRQTLGEIPWESPTFGQAADRYDVRISGGANRVQLTTR